jgi:HAD superfamily hydrolase (TIGR01509 family)
VVAPNVRWNEVSHVLLDMDGTVLDLAFDAFLWGHEVPRRYGLLKGLSLSAARAELQPYFRDLAHTLRWYDTSFWARLTGLDIAAIHLELRERITIHPGSVAFLEAVRASGRALWLTTNAFPDSVAPKLAQTGLARYFDVIVSSADVGAPKEEQAYWERLCARHPFDPAHALFADDSPQVLASAARYGIAQLVGMHHPDSTEGVRDLHPFASVARLDELLPIAPERPNTP